MQRRALSSAGLIFFAGSLAVTAPAAGKDVRIAPHVAPSTDAPLTPEESAALGRSLNFDAIALSTPVSAGSFGASAVTHRRGLHVDRSEHPDGSNTVTIMQPLRDHARFGADFNVAGAPVTNYQPDKPLPGAIQDKPSGAAWASLSLTDFATVDARVDPRNKQGKLGATVAYSMPLSKYMSVSLHGHYAVSDTLPAATSTQDASATAPVLSDDQAVKLNIGSTGTTLSARVNTNSADPVAHNTLSAEQTVYGPLHVTTAITDPGQSTSDKSISAGFDLTW